MYIYVYIHMYLIKRVIVSLFNSIYLNLISIFIMCIYTLR